MADTYDKGDGCRISVAFTGADAVTLLDPNTVVLKIKAPSGTVTTYTYGVDAALVKDSVGNYHFDLELTAKGLWWYRWVGSGAVPIVEEGSIPVRGSNVV